MFATRLFAAFAVSFGLFACGNDPEPAREPPPVKDTFAGDLVGTMDKARSVQDTTMQQKEEVDRAVDAAETKE